jgi:NAD(P)-dependent dehydrogenase (short-subunit alcohol dehydrogenase family)
MTVSTIIGRRQDKLDETVKLIGKNVTGVQGDAANLADLDRLYETVKREKGRIDILFASAGFGEFAKLEEVTEEHFDKTFDLNVRGTLFTVQKALPLFNDNECAVSWGRRRSWSMGHLRRCFKGRNRPWVGSRICGCHWVA